MATERKITDNEFTKLLLLIPAVKFGDKDEVREIKIHSSAYFYSIKIEKNGNEYQIKEMYSLSVFSLKSVLLLSKYKEVMLLKKLLINN